MEEKGGKEEEGKEEGENEGAEEKSSILVPALLERQGVLVGVKADAGLAPLDDHPDALEGDTVTLGLERLPEIPTANQLKNGQRNIKTRSNCSTYQATVQS